MESAGEPLMAPVPEEHNEQHYAAMGTVSRDLHEYYPQL